MQAEVNLSKDVSKSTFDISQQNDGDEDTSQDLTMNVSQNFTRDVLKSSTSSQNLMRDASPASQNSTTRSIEKKIK